MKKRIALPAALAVALLAASSYRCTGGQETEAETVSTKTPAATAQPASGTTAIDFDTKQKLATISPAIPLYPDTTYRADLSNRDAVTIRNQFGPDAQVYTLATDASFPQVWHYYVTYLAQFRSYNPPSPYPQASQNWRTMQVHLNDAMKDPFVPGDDLSTSTQHVILQIAETEAEPPTVIRYIVTTRPVAPQQQVALQ
jgi:hypothetical protein